MNRSLSPKIYSAYCPVVTYNLQLIMMHVHHALFAVLRYYVHVTPSVYDAWNLRYIESGLSAIQAEDKTDDILLQKHQPCRSNKDKAVSRPRVHASQRQHTSVRAEIPSTLPPKVS